MDLKGAGWEGTGWIHLRALLNTVINLRIPQSKWGLLASQGLSSMKLLARKFNYYVADNKSHLPIQSLSIVCSIDALCGQNFGFFK
jgi:hypothetical protein